MGIRDLLVEVRHNWVVLFPSALHDVLRISDNSIEKSPRLISVIELNGLKYRASPNLGST